MGPGTNIYQPNDMSQEEVYLKNNLTLFYKYIVFVEEVDPFGANLKVRKTQEAGGLNCVSFFFFL